MAKFDITGILTLSIPRTAIRCSAHKGRGTITVTNVAPMTIRPTTPRQPSFKAYINSQPDKLKWAYRDIKMSNIQPLVKALQQGTLQGICDGSYFPNKSGVSTSAWIITDGQTRISGCNITPGDSDVQNAYRAELAGVYAIITMTNLLSQYYNVTGTMTIACDNDTALHQVDKREVRTTVRDEHFDLVSAIRYWACKSKVKWITKEVKAHQDGRTKQLSTWEVLNNEVDIAAKAAGYKFEEYPCVSQAINGEMWTLWKGKYKICKQFKEKIRHFTSGTDCLDYWDSKDRFQNAPHDVEWEATAAVMKELPIKRRHWITKTCANEAPTAVTLARRREWKSSLCPRCGKTDEDSFHILVCEDPKATNAWDTAMTELNQWMTDQQTEQSIQDLILQGVQSLRTGEIPTIRKVNLVTPCMVQREMGWYSMFTGCAAEGWSGQQQHHYNTLGKRKTGKRWLVSLLKKLLDISWDQWKIRNGIVHAPDSSPLSKRCDTFISECFLLPATIWDDDTKKLLQHQHTLLQKHVTSRYAWCVRVHSALTYSQITTTHFDP